MVVTSASKSLLFATLILVIGISQSFADHEHHGQHCQQNSDCGNGPDFVCHTDTGECTCPGGSQKSYVVIRGAKPQCQKVSAIGDSCNYNEQCSGSFGQAGLLSRCNKNKCECYDTVTSGRDVVRPYKGVCYTATAVGEQCTTPDQCRAFIQPEESVTCAYNSTTGRKLCSCLEGQHCTEKSGAETVAVGFTSLVTLAVAGLLANKYVV